MKLNLKKVLVAAALVCGASLAVGSVNLTSADAVTEQGQGQEQDKSKGFSLLLEGQKCFLKSDEKGKSIWEKFDVEKTGKALTTGEIDQAALDRLGDVLISIKDLNDNVVADGLNASISCDFRAVRDKDGNIIVKKDANGEYNVMEKSGAFSFSVEKVQQTSDEGKNAVENLITRFKNEKGEGVYKIEVRDKKDSNFVVAIDKVKASVFNM